MTASRATVASVTKGSLRLRLAIWNAVVVVLTALATLIVLRQGVQWALIHEIDEILAEDIGEIELALRDTPPNQFDVITHDLERKAVGHRHHGWFVQLRDDRGNPAWASDNRHQEAIFSPADHGDYTTTNHEERVIRHKAPLNRHGIKTIVVGEQLQLLRNEIVRIDRLVVGTAAIVLLVAPLCGYWLASRAANVVGEITRSALRLRPDHLDERLPMQGTGDELDRLAQTINGFLDRIAAFLEQKRDVLANAAHELRTPVAAIRSSVEVALNGNRSATEYQDLLEDVIDQIAALETLLNQLLLLSETEAERLKTQLEIVSLHDLVAKSTSMFHGVAESRDIRLVIDRLDAARIAGNRVHLWQVVNNLIDNALKYTSKGGRIDVALSVDRVALTAELMVQDNGRGIAVEDLPRVFERFFRSDRSRTRNEAPAGAGLGLSICKAVVEAHSGQIDCESDLGKGTTVRVWFPLAADANPPRDLLPAPLASAN